jgi:hypothetical protein
MNLLELVTYLRDNILDDSGGQGVDWTGYSDTDFDSVQLRWTNEELVSNINEAIRLVYRRINPVKDLITVNVLTGTPTYSLPNYVTKIIGVKREDGKGLKEETLESIWELKDMGSKPGDLSKYIPDDVSNTLRLFPIPLKDEVLSVMIYRLPLVELSWISNLTSPELRADFHIPMLFYAAHLCYLKDEANTLDPTRAREFLAMFDREFPFVSAYSNVRKRRTTNRAIKYGGL